MNNTGRWAQRYDGGSSTLQLLAGQAQGVRRQWQHCIHQQFSDVFGIVPGGIILGFVFSTLGFLALPGNYVTNVINVFQPNLPTWILWSATKTSRRKYEKSFCKIRFHDQIHLERQG